MPDQLLAVSSDAPPEGFDEVVKPQRLDRGAPPAGFDEIVQASQGPPEGFDEVVQPSSETDKEIGRIAAPQTSFQPPATKRTPLDIGMPPGPTEAEKQAEYALYEQPHPGRGGIYVQPEAQRPSIINPEDEEAARLAVGGPPRDP